MSAILPGLRKSFSAAKRIGRLSSLFIVIVFCSGMALFAATKAWRKLNAAHRAGVHKPAQLKGKQLAGYKSASNFAKGSPVSIDYGGHDFTLHTGKPTGILLTSSGVDAYAPGVYGSPGILGSGLTFSQNGVALDAAGNMFVTDMDSGNEVVKKIAADGSSTTIIGSGFITQSANTAIDKAGNVYVVDQGRVSKIPVGAAPGTYDAPVVINGTFTRPFAIAADTAGNIYVTDLGVGVFKMTNDGTNKVKIDNAIANGSGIALDAAGNVYVCDYVSLALYKIPAGGGPEVQLANGFGFPRAVAVDGMGNIFVCDENAGSIYEVGPGGGTPVAVISGLANNVGLAVDASYNLYIGLQASGGVSKYSPVGGYFINQPLPAGLNFDNTTGAISGKPTTATAEKSYIVSAYNIDGGITDTLRISVAASGPAPVVSYSNPIVDTLGVRINPITPSATGIDAPGFAPFVAVANGFFSPFGIASDAAGNIYVADWGNNIIKKMPADGSPIRSLGSGFNQPSGVAVDASGFIYVADAGNGQVEKMSADGLTIIPIGSGFIKPVGVALDGAGNVYVADADAGSVYKILASDGSTVMLSGTFDALTGIAVDKTGQNIYVSDSAANSVYKVSPTCGCPEDLGFYFNFPMGVALDPQGSLYVSDVDIMHGNSVVYKGDGKGCNFVSTGSSPSFPTGVTIDPTGNLFVADAISGILYELTPSGGYFLATTLPKGLKLNDTTGIITGKPAVLSPAADYTVIGYNANGGTAALVNIAIIPPPPPTLNYTTPNNYLAGISVTPLKPTSTYVAKADYSDTLVTIGTGFNAPRGTAVDKSGNVFVADSLNNRVMMIPVGGGPPVPWGYGFNGPTSVAVDSLGYVYVADYGNQLIKMISPNGVSVTQLASIDEPMGVAVDSARNVYTVDMSTGFVDKISLTDFSVTPINDSFPFPYPTGIAAGAKDVYVSDGLIGGVARLTPGVALPDLIGSFNYPAGVAVDGGGNLYVSDEGDSTIYRFPAGSHTGAALSTTGLSGPEGLSVDGRGNLYVADVNNNLVAKIAPDGGFYINKPVPGGLSFNSKTGTISGTPAAASTARDYTVTAYNASGSIAATFNIGIALPPHPTLSYTSPNVYTIGVAIPPLTPVISNNTAASYTANPTTVSTGFTFISGIATDKAGNIYVADAAANTVIKLPPGGTGSPEVLSTDLDEPQNVAVDAAGNVYIADAGNGAIKKIPNGSGTPVSIGVGFEYPVGVAVDATGNVYVADERSGSNGAVYKLVGGKGPHISVTSQLHDPVGVAVDGAGNVFILDAHTEAVYKLTGGTGSPVRIGPWLNVGAAITVDNGGNVYVSDAVLGVVYVIPAGGGTDKTIGNLGLPVGVAVDGSGNLYVSDPFENSLKELPPAGGIYINPNLPAGLVFDSNTGSISGTPVAPSPATNYIVTAFNPGGNVSDTLSIKVKSNVATLSALSTSVRPVSPVFKSAVNSYTTAALPFSAASTKITAKPTDSGATVQVRVNGGSYVPATNGGPSADLALNTGTNTIDILVTSEDSSASKIYTITMVRPVSALLSTLTYTPSVVKTKVAGSNYADYTATVKPTQSSISVIPVAQDANAVITVNGTPVVSGATSDPIALSVGTTTINTVITASDGSVSNTYSIVITRPADALLTSLTYDPSLTIVKVAGSHDFDYAATIYKAVSSIKVYPVTEDPTSTVTVNGGPVTSGGASDPITLAVGPNVINTVVTAADGVTTKTYSITITRMPNALLSTLTFDPNVTKVKVPGSNYVDYTATVKPTQSVITVTPVTQDPTSTVTVNGQPVASGETSDPIALNVGATTINTVVTASDGTTSNTYSIVITRPADALLTSLTYDPGLTVVKTTGSHDFDYMATVYKINSIKVIPVAEDPAATITVNGNTVSSGNSSAAIPLAIGANVINTIVTATDGTTTKTYSITVNRVPNALLATLTYSPALSKIKVAGPDYVDYTATVPNSISSVTATPVTQDQSSTVTVNGQVVASGAASDPIALTVGANTINTVVTAEDGTTSNTYAIVITRQPPPGFAMLYEPPKESPVTTTLVVHQNVSPNGDGTGDVLTIDGITNYPDNKLQIMSRNGDLVYEAKGYDNATKVFDGHASNGKLQQAGTYFYSLDYKDGDQMKRQTGFIVLKY